MTDRPTAEIVADLRVVGILWAREAADRLADVAAALPDCPTCGGTGWQRNHGPHAHGHVPDCPDCDHGKVTVARLAATWQAVWDDSHESVISPPHMLAASEDNVWDLAVDTTLDYLRSVRPPSPKEGT